MPRDDEALEPVWNGTMDKLGTCPSLTGYRGPSSLAGSADIETLTYGEVLELRARKRRRKSDDLQEAA